MIQSDERVRDFAKTRLVATTLYMGKRKHCVPDESNPLSLSLSRERENTHAVRCAAERNARRSGAVLCPFSLTWFAGVGKRRRLDDWTTKDTKNGREKEERAPRSRVEKMCVKNSLLFFCAFIFYLHFLPSLFGRVLERNCEVDLTHP